ncbi:EAL domain-containing protein [Pseudahrensia aquimaris]|uniref:EAL domain-containing protein n=1 Tax=Pseudahrensia aquimaris TaxID=744461 RepID=A0ABW3FD89_9HYPH
MAQFLETFHALKRAYCLCDGLEIISANAAFLTLFAMNAKQVENTLLDQLIANQRATENLFAYCGETIELTNTNHPDGRRRDLAVTLHRSAKNSATAIIEFEDRTQQVALAKHLHKTEATDPQSGALRAGAFEKEVQKRLALCAPKGEPALLINLRMNAQSTTGMGLTFVQRGALLQTLTTRLQEEFGEDCPVGRTDALSLSFLTDTSEDADEHAHMIAQARRITATVIKQFNAPLEIQIGAALFPDHGFTVQALLNCSILAQASPFIDFFSSELREKSDRRAALLDALPAALRCGEIAPHFQPVINAADNKLIGFEALVRWQHPTLGRVIPPDIVEMATSLGLLHELTAKILACALDEARNWPAGVHFAINVTPSQLNTKLVDLVRSAVRSCEIEPSRLEIEVTEEALIDNFDASADIIARLRAIGVCVAMDDFGSGYTSIGNLRRLAFSKIKIDKSISDGLPDDPKTIAIVRSLMIMARELDVEVTVEGIETEPQLDFLRAFHCGVQGYVFSPPLPPENLSKLRPFLHPSDRKSKAPNVLAIGPKKRGASKS